MLPTELFKEWGLYKYLSIFSGKFTKTLKQAASAPIILATAQNSFFKREQFYYSNFAEGETPAEEALDPVLAYRLWEISESILIECTSSFDSYLRVGDHFSSLNIIEDNAETDDVN